MRTTRDRAPVRPLAEFVPSLFSYITYPPYPSCGGWERGHRKKIAHTVTGTQGLDGEKKQKKKHRTALTRRPQQSPSTCCLSYMSEWNALVSCGSARGQEKEKVENKWREASVEGGNTNQCIWSS